MTFAVLVPEKKKFEEFQEKLAAQALARFLFFTHALLKSWRFPLSLSALHSGDQYLLFP